MKKVKDEVIKKETKSSAEALVSIWSVKMWCKDEKFHFPISVNSLQGTIFVSVSAGTGVEVGCRLL